MSIPFFLNILGLETGHSSAESLVNCMQIRYCKQVSAEKWVHTSTGLQIESRCAGGQKDAGNFFILRNEGEKPVPVAHFSARQTMKCGGATSADLFIHWFSCCWQTEFQHHGISFQQADIVPVSVHPIVKSFSVQSRGSYTTANYFPFLAVENRVTGETLYCEFCPGANWRIETGMIGDEVYLSAAEIDERNLSVLKILKSGEEYRTAKALFGVVSGGVNEAIRDLTLKRRLLRGGKAKPVVFNDYMNCCWTRPSEKLTRALIDAAADAGAEVFCIDDGWQYERDEDRTNRLGDWEYSRTLFGKDGFQRTMEYIREKGMIPGLWFELEVAGENSEIYKKPEDWFLRRRDIRVGGGARVFFDFRNPQVCGYILEKLRFYYQLGIRYIKNDYNDCIGNGGEDAIEYTRAVRNFYSMVRKTFPDLMMENCASGAMRCDGGMLEIFDLQSTSDQERWENYPSIAQGAAAMLLPEQAANWAYPFPLYNEDFFKDGKITSSSAREIAYTMITGMCGVLYLSGRIDTADEQSKKLIREGVACYKRIREFLAEAYPVFPNGFTHIADKRSPVAVLLRNDESDRALLYVWRQKGEEKTEIPVKAKSVEVLYPKQFGGKVEVRENALSVRLYEEYSAVLLQLELVVQ